MFPKLDISTPVSTVLYTVQYRGSRSQWSTGPEFGSRDVGSRDVGGRDVGGQDVGGPDYPHPNRARKHNNWTKDVVTSREMDLIY